MARVLVERPYPVDARGFAVPVQELPEPIFASLEGEVINNHHMNYYARSFGRFLVSKTFRDLESQQTPLVVWRHELLHRVYSGIDLPPLENMMEEIERAKAEGEKLKVYDQGQKRYFYHAITDVAWKQLSLEYGRLKT